MMRPLTVAALAYEGISPFHLAVPCLVFGEDRRAAGVPSFSFRVCAATPGRVLATEAGLGLVAPHELSALATADIVIVPSWHGPETPVPAEILAALRAAHRRGALLVGLCLGAFPLAAAGLLDGRAATTHWLATAALAAGHKAVRVREGDLYVDAGSVITSAGVAAALDCCLHVVRRVAGAEAARRLARRIVLSPHRQGSQAQFIDQPLAASPAEDALAGAVAAVLADLAGPHTLDATAARAHLGRRTFTRHFLARYGTSFTRWLRAQRLLRARQLLETTRLGVDEVARLSGFGTATALRQHFAAALRTSPSLYRREFAHRPPAWENAA